MKKVTILLALCFLPVLWTNGTTHSGPIDGAAAGNIPEGMYMIVGEASHRCLEIPNASCASGVGLQTLDCDATGSSNNQKFNIVADGSGNYTIAAAHSDLCLEVYDEDDSGRIPVKQNACTPGKVSQQWAMSQYGVNLEIRAVQNNLCMDVMGKVKGNYGQVNLRPCANGTNQRWRLSKKTLNSDTGIICTASPSHPEHSCSGLNDKQAKANLGKTLTKARCEAACTASKMVNCQWDTSQ